MDPSEAELRRRSLGTANGRGQVLQCASELDAWEEALAASTAKAQGSSVWAVSDSMRWAAKRARLGGGEQAWRAGEMRHWSLRTMQRSCGTAESHT